MLYIKRLTRQGGLRGGSYKIVVQFCDIKFRPTYTSNHYHFQREDLFSYLKLKGMNYKITNNHAQLEQCPFCPHTNFNERSNTYTLGISLENGTFNCFRSSCQARGSWFDFKNKLNGNLQENKESVELIQLPIGYKYICSERLKNKNPEEGYSYLTDTRGLNEECLNHYEIGLDIENGITLIVMPMFRMLSESETAKIKKENQQRLKQDPNYNMKNEYFEFVSCKLRPADPAKKYSQFLKPSNAAKGIFGIQTIKPDTQEIILTEGEFDSIAAYQMTGIPSISLPYGINHLPSYLVEWLDRFEHLHTIYIWVDDDVGGRINSEKIARKLGIRRCKIVQPSLLNSKCYPKDANQALIEFRDEVDNYISKAQSSFRKNIIKHIDLKNKIRSNLLDPNIDKGFYTSTFDQFNSTLNGIRPGEFTILTGPTGSGKTTFLSQVSVEIAKQRIACLWGSFEIKNERLMEHQLYQAFKTNIKGKEDLILRAQSRFDNFPMYYMNFYGSQNIDTVMDTMEYAIYEYQIAFICLDNLQFLMGNQYGNFEKFDYQDKIVEKFRQLATKSNVHVALVIHPKKVDENEDLQVSSVFGSAKSTQEADNVIILQQRDRYRIVDIKKNRYSGNIGRSCIGFDHNVKSYFELKHSEIESLEERIYSISDIISSRKKGKRHFKEELYEDDQYDGLQQQITQSQTSKNRDQKEPIKQEQAQQEYQEIDEIKIDQIKNEEQLVIKKIKPQEVLEKQENLEQKQNGDKKKKLIVFSEDIDFDPFDEVYASQDIIGAKVESKSELDDNLELLQLKEEPKEDQIQSNDSLTDLFSATELLSDIGVPYLSEEDSKHPYPLYKLDDHLTPDPEFLQCWDFQGRYLAKRQQEEKQEKKKESLKEVTQVQPVVQEKQPKNRKKVISNGYKK